MRRDSHNSSPTCLPWSAVLPCGDSHQTGGDAVPTQSPEQSEILVHRDGAVLTLTFNRPEARNAMTWNMYERLYQTSEEVDADDSLRVLVLRGAGGKAFVAGTDISQFTTFRTAEDGLQYERDGARRGWSVWASRSSRRSRASRWAAASPSPPYATSVSPPRSRASASPSRAPLATASPWRTTRAAWNSSALPASRR